jgi:hypothetical protein
MMPDHSQLDNFRFIDWARHNCPFCNRRHVSYLIESYHKFDWTDSKTCTAFFVKCQSCSKQSLHLSFDQIGLDGQYWRGAWRFKVDQKDLDALFFYSVPTNFFTLNENIPRQLRELFTEAEGCLKSNFLTGASACARKLIYELSAREGAAGENYEERLKSLKSLKPEVDATYFDTLLTVQQVTSSKVHEGAYDGWESRHLQVILAAIHEVLVQLYVLPSVREESRKRVLALRTELLKPAEQGSNGETS